MSDTATTINLGTTGVHYVEAELTPEVAAEVERLGYTALWIAGTREARLTTVERVLAATEMLVVATGVVNVWHMDARAVAETYHWLETAHPGRFLLGIGAGASGVRSRFPIPVSGAG
jgi:alkanesulfonate monooxygenase SsuD/methylene tetrahydromethanopterin reductase-like flavin-dependent oxidoreductase (luciferase family)